MLSIGPIHLQVVTKGSLLLYSRKFVTKVTFIAKLTSGDIFSACLRDCGNEVATYMPLWIGDHTSHGFGEGYFYYNVVESSLESARLHAFVFRVEHHRQHGWPINYR